MKDKQEQYIDIVLEIKGWAGVYKTTRNNKAAASDFSSNFISLFAHKKLGMFDILPVVSKNKLNEVYVVGQLHVDMFEATNLPDMALSNRQGYKSDDERYKKVVDYVRANILPELVNLRSVYSSIKKSKSENNRHRRNKEKEEELKNKANEFRDTVVNDLIDISSSSDSKEKKINNLKKSIEKNSKKILGLKSKVDAAKKKVLISHTKNDKQFADIIYEMLKFNGFNAEEILYSNSDDTIARIPSSEDIFKYLRTFFVDSISDRKIYVIYVTSDNMNASWGAVSEIGAGWITKSGHSVFSLNNFTPKKPINTEKQWQQTIVDENGDMYCDHINRDLFVEIIKDTCNEFNIEPKKDEENYAELDKWLNIIEHPKEYNEIVDKICKKNKS